MDPDITHTLLKYDSQVSEWRNKFLIAKTVQQLKQTSVKQVQLQFDILSSADISAQCFNQEYPKMNRYIDIHAYQHSRVKLNHIPNYYINANQVKSLVDGNAPVKHYDNFWEAVYFKNVTITVMLCSFYDPKRGHQSQQYWPDAGKHTAFSTGKLIVKNTEFDDNDKQYVVNKFEIQGPEGVKKLTHIHWMGWSDLKKPAQSNMKRFQQILTICLNEIQNKKLIWIHCSAGIGRTGTLGGIIQAIRLYEKNKSFSIFAIVENMRKYRYHAVQTFQQYKFLYQYLIKKLS